MLQIDLRDVGYNEFNNTEFIPILMGASQCVNKAKNLLLLGNREQGTGNREQGTGNI
ncbi:MAG: hypothetical protein F6K54_30875 [Okeania sp. SIO3B5]|uniref:hypothetical protein n=1 Tax=Okeania sp. SIO3B5 TaxID=2607811 RepID=UPI001400F7F9|nr:hypothetical protein [Okeania sp. SIO3B5]NEO57090.1 hypothetical protein [Okeania sp. SIO3B5]